MAYTIPAEMKAIEISSPGGPDVLSLVTRPVPEPGKHELLIKVASAGLNGADVTQRKGAYPMPQGVTDIPGLEVAGTVVAAGSNTNRIKIGQPVCALISGGGYAEYATAPEPQCMYLPAQVELLEAGGIPETFCTVWTNLIDRGALKSGETVLVQGGSSGIGCTAIQIAKLFGATVFSTARTEEKCRAIQTLGVDRAINYTTESFLDVCREVTDGRGVDVILDIVGGPYIPMELELLAFGGRLVFINLTGGKVVEANFGLIHSKHLTITGSRLRPRSIEEKAEICRDLEQKVWPLFEKGEIKSVTHSQFPLSDVANAHRLMESSEHIGKILLIP